MSGVAKLEATTPPFDPVDRYASYWCGVEEVVAEVLVLVEVPGEELVVLVSVELELVLDPPPAAGFTIVVLFSVFLSVPRAAGVTVVDFCSQAASKAAPARRVRRCLFIVGFTV